MKRIIPLLLVAGALAFAAGPVYAAGLTVTLDAGAANPKTPQMGDHLTFHSTITNTDSKVHDGVIAWVSLVQVDKGLEQPVDLEDWSAHKAIAKSQLKPGKMMQTEWPMRLIQPGHYRVVVSTVSRQDATLTPSPFVDFHVKSKPVVESTRVIPIAMGVPGLLIGFVMVSALRHRRMG